MKINLDQYEALRPMASVAVDDQNPITFFTPNKVAFWRVETLFTKEPATTAWLDRLKPGMVLLDVGANVGMYSILGAKAKGATVYAFEPESQNFSLLAKNIVLNQLEKLVTPYCVALSDTIKLDRLYLSEFKWDGGSSCHSFGAEVGFDLNHRSSAVTQGCAAWTIDEAVRGGAIEVPDFIKIDVDGFEHKVVQGALQTLQNKKVRSLCVEINTNLKEHRGLVEFLQSMGFYFDNRQVELVTRKKGAFKGCAEYIFDRLPDQQLDVQQGFTYQPGSSASTGEAKAAFDHVYNKIANSDIKTDPFPYMVIDEIFPKDYYRRMLDMFPPEATLTPLSETGRVTADKYKERLVALFTDDTFARMDPERKAFWMEFGKYMYSPEFIELVTRRFLPWCANRLSALYERYGRMPLRSDAMLVSDRTDYAIGPHTDAKHRLISFLFYMPKDLEYQDLGTSLYRHKDPDFFCKGGPHYKFKDFVYLSTVNFIPNRLLTFVRTGRSFHGVEQITRPNVDRRLLVNNIRILEDVK